jgi:hypothetical protein
MVWRRSYTLAEDPDVNGGLCVDRRNFLKTLGSSSAGILITWRGSKRLHAAIPGGSLDPTTISKYAMPLVVPPAMPPAISRGRVDYYEIAVRQFEQQIAPGIPPTTVWGYGSAANPSTFNYPAFTIEASYNRRAGDRLRPDRSKQEKHLRSHTRTSGPHGRVDLKKRSKCSTQPA